VVLKDEDNDDMQLANSDCVVACSRSMQTAEVQVLSLTSSCRRSIRRHLLTTVNARLFTSVTRLPLPSALQQFLLLAELDSIQT